MVGILASDGLRIDVSLMWDGLRGDGDLLPLASNINGGNLASKLTLLLVGLRWALLRSTAGLAFLSFGLFCCRWWASSSFLLLVTTKCKPESSGRPLLERFGAGNFVVADVGSWRLDGPATTALLTARSNLLPLSAKLWVLECKNFFLLIRLDGNYIIAKLFWFSRKRE